jgi:hypothetical protein
VAIKSIKEGDSLVAAELQDIKRLPILLLFRSGALQGDVAAALNVNQSSISRMFPKGVGSKSSPSRKRK